MNIAFVNSTKKWGGVKTWIMDFAGKLTSYGHNVYIWGRQPQFVEKGREIAGHGEAVTFGPDFNPVAIARFLHQFASKKIQAVFINVGKDLTTAGVAAKLLGIPVIQQIGLPQDIGYSKKTHRLHDWIEPHFLCSCEFIRTGFVESLPYITDPMTRTILTAKVPSPRELTVNRPLRFIATSQLNSDKGHETMLRAFARLTVPFEFHVLGTGTDEDKLKALATELGLENKVVWHGWSKDVLAHLREADVFVLGSLSEGLPNTLQEALAEGLVTLGRDVGGVREVWPEEMLHLLLPYESGPDEFLEAFTRVASASDEEVLVMKESGRQSCRDLFDLEAKGRELESWLRREVIRN